MPELRRLSGDEVVSIFRSFGFRVAAQHGSHIKRVRDSSSGRQVLTIPAHRELDTGTLHAIADEALHAVGVVALPHRV